MKVIIFVLLAINANSENPSLSMDEKPDRCNRPADFMYTQCCVFPPFFTREVAKQCGAFYKVTTIDEVNNITGFRRHTMSLCHHWKCMLQKYDLLIDSDKIDHDKYYSHLDRWAVLNPSFSEVMLKAKHYCMSTFRMFLPLKVCEFYDIHGCIRNYVNVHCPVVFPTKECYEKQQFYEECKNFYE